MRNLNYFIALLTFFFVDLNAQNCPILNENGDFETENNVVGLEPAIGITTGNLQNWFASHGTVDYITADWDWYANLPEITSNAGHLCYGNRDSHEHSEGMFSEANISGSEDHVYTLSLDYGSVCDDELPGYLHIYVNSGMTAESHLDFAFPTAENSPQLFENAQMVKIIELGQGTDVRGNGLSHIEVSFTAEQNFENIWFFSEYQHPFTDFVNCGLVLDNVQLTAQNVAIDQIDITETNSGKYRFTAMENSEAKINSFSWELSTGAISSDDNLEAALEEGAYTICLDFTDEIKACGSVCRDFTIGKSTSKTLCNYYTCLDYGGIPTIDKISLFDGSNHITLDASSPYFHFPYCLASPEVCDSGINEMEILTSDLSNWIETKGYYAVVELLDGSNNIDDGCRSRILSIESSELTFDEINVIDYASNIEYVSFFERKEDTCEQLTLPNDENILQETDQQNFETTSEEGIQVSVSPNPVTSFIKIESSTETNSPMKITDSAGNVLLTSNYQEGNNVDVSGLNPGLYFLTINSSKGTAVSRFIKH